MKHARYICLCLIFSIIGLGRVSAGQIVHSQHELRWTEQTSSTAPTPSVPDLQPFRQTSDSDDLPVFIVQLDAPPLALYEGGLPDLSATSPQALGQNHLDLSSPDSVDYLAYSQHQQQRFISDAEALIGHRLNLSFTYNTAFNGFAAEMTPSEAGLIATLEGVRRVTPDIMRQLHTDVGPGWIGAAQIWDGSATQGVLSQGEGVVVGIIDSGINMDHPSFADPGPVDGYNYNDPFGAGVYKGLCATQPA